MRFCFFLLSLIIVGCSSGSSECSTCPQGAEFDVTIAKGTPVSAEVCVDSDCTTGTYTPGAALVVQAAGHPITFHLSAAQPGGPNAVHVLAMPGDATLPNGKALRVTLRAQDGTISGAAHTDPLTWIHDDSCGDCTFVPRPTAHQDV